MIEIRPSSARPGSFVVENRQTGSAMTVTHPWPSFETLLVFTEDRPYVSLRKQHYEHARQCVNAVAEIQSAMRAYLPPGGISKDEFINIVLGAVDNREIV